MNCKLYHIARKDAPLSEGYIGVSNNPDSRFRKHLRNAKNPNKNHRPIYQAINEFDDIEFRVIDSGSEEYIYEQERKLRPRRNMGWNTIAGGYSSAH